MKTIKLYLTLSLIVIISEIKAQEPLSMVVNLAQLDGIEVSLDNIFNFQIINNEGQSRQLHVRGSLIYKNNGLRLSYNFTTTVYPGVNMFSNDKVYGVKWNFSENAFKELFVDYKKLPQGTYEYCVEISLERKLSEEVFPDPVDACIYHTVNDIFLISLITPDDEAKIYEHNPMLSWMVNYPFASELSYKLRLTELKEGQNKENAVNRNNLVFSDNNLMLTSTVYPFTATPLKVYQPYVWTVDAYYKGILLGGAEPWSFTIIEDSFYEKTQPISQSYIDIEVEKIKNAVFAVGELKLKYDLRYMDIDTLRLQLFDREKEIKLKTNELVAKAGNNWYEIDFSDQPRLKHNRFYTLNLVNRKGRQYKVTFKYINPDFYE